MKYTVIPQPQHLQIQPARHYLFQVVPLTTAQARLKNVIGIQ